MTDQSYAPEAEADIDDDVAFNDVDESGLYEEMEKRVGGDDEPETPQKNWQEEAEKAEKRFQDQQKRAKAERKEKQALAKRLEELEAKFAAPKAADVDDDDFGDENDDPIGVLAKVKALAKQLKEGERAEKLTAAERQKEIQREQGLASTLQESEADFRKIKPDYDKAVDHFKRERAKELLETGVGQDELPMVLKREFLELIERADKTGKEPAEVVYALAMRRGYSLDAGKEKLQTIRDTQKAGRSLSSASGRNGEGSQLTVASVSQLRGKALLDGFAKLKEQEKRQARR